MHLVADMRCPIFLSLMIFCQLSLIQPVQAGPYSALVAEVESGQPLYEKNADELRHPASLTKMMTLYLVFESLAHGRLSLDSRFQASRYAILRPPSRLGLAAGDSITVEQGILALVTRSANDAAAVIAENMAGSEAAFAEFMTARARQLGMNSTVYRNASGLPDPLQVTTAWDMFRLGQAIYKKFPQYYPYFATGSFYYDGRSFHNHNHLLETYPGADGIKTGFINSSGFNLVASAKRHGHRLIGVVFGGNSAAQRDRHMRDILDDGFAQLDGALPRIITADFDQTEAPSLLAKPESDRADESLAMARLAARKAKSSRDQGDGREAVAAGKRNWQVRIGEFPSEKAAEQQLSRALRLGAAHLRSARGAVSAHSRRGKKVYTAHFSSLSKAEAEQACGGLRRKHLRCSLARLSF